MQLSEKEMLEMADRMMGHLSAIEKYGVFSRHCQDQEIRTVLDRHQAIFRQHYQVMQNFLQGQGGAVNYGTTFTGQTGGWTPGNQ